MKYYEMETSGITSDFYVEILPWAWSVQAYRLPWPDMITVLLVEPCKTWCI